MAMDITTHTVIITQDTTHTVIIVTFHSVGFDFLMNEMLCGCAAAYSRYPLYQPDSSFSHGKMYDTPLKSVNNAY